MDNDRYGDNPNVYHGNANDPDSPIEMDALTLAVFER